MITVSVISYKYQDLDILLNVLEDFDCEVKKYIDDVEINFTSCFDSDFLIFASNSTYIELADFMNKNRLAVLLERKIAGGQKVITIGNSSNLLFSSPEILLDDVENNSKVKEILLEQWLAFTTNDIHTGDIRLKGDDAYNTSISQKNQYLVYEKASKGFTANNMLKPLSEWGYIGEREILVGVNNRCLRSFLFNFTSKKYCYDVFKKIIRS